VPPPEILSRAAGIDLSAYRATHVSTQISRALERERVTDVATLARVLDHDPEARHDFRRSVAVSVTGLFRDPGQFELLERLLLPPLLARQGRIRVWSAGCSSGAELYSVAALLQRAGALDRSFLLGSDILDENIALARRGEHGGSRPEPPLHAVFHWEQRDLAAGSTPAPRFQLILCRNVLIYLSPPAKKRVHALLAGALARDGILLLGRSERLARPQELGLVAEAPQAYRRAA